MFRYHLLGIEVVLRRGLVYAVLTATVIGGYLLVTAIAGSRLNTVRCRALPPPRWSRSG